MFECERIDERDADGNLEVAGLAWAEHPRWFERVAEVLIFLMLNGLPTAGVTAVLMTIEPDKPWLLLAGAWFLLVSPVLWYYRVRVAGKIRQLRFQRDGRMAVPKGLPFKRRVRFISGTQADVVSLEVRQTVSNHEAQRTAHSSGVVMFKRNGDMVYIAKRLHPDHAHKVAVQLMLALTELREELASGVGQGATRQQASRGGRSKATVEVFID